MGSSRSLCSDFISESVGKAHLHVLPDYIQSACVELFLSRLLSWSFLYPTVLVVFRTYLSLFFVLIKGRTSRWQCTAHLAKDDRYHRIGVLVAGPQRAHQIACVPELDRAAGDDGFFSFFCFY